MVWGSNQDDTGNGHTEHYETHNHGMLRTDGSDWEASLLWIEDGVTLADTDDSYTAADSCGCIPVRGNKTQVTSKNRRKLIHSKIQSVGRSNVLST